MKINQGRNLLHPVHGAIAMMLFIFLTGCSVLQQTSEMKNFGRCEFRLEKVDDVKLAGINIQSKGSVSELGIFDYARITSAVGSGYLPLSFKLFVKAKNPNNGMAAMNKMDWILYIDKIEMTRGSMQDRIEIPSLGTTTFPVEMTFDLLKALSGESGDALMNFAFNLNGSGERPTRITLKARPTIYINGTAIEYPGYISITQEFGQD